MADSASEGVRLLQEALGDRTSLPGSAAYAGALDRVFFPDAARRRPACVVEPASAADVPSIMQIAQRTGCSVTVRGGGLSSNCVSDGAVMVDLSARMDHAVSDGVVVVGGGATSSTVSTRSRISSRGSPASGGASSSAAAPASQNVLVRKDESDLVTVVVSHPVNPADEEAFLAWQDRVTDAERGFDGFRGAELFRPVAGVQEEWTALYRFDSGEHLDAWLDSPERRRLLDEGKRFKNFSLKRISVPFGSWFAPPGKGDGAAAPPDWKTAFSVLVGLYPTVVLLSLAVSEIWKKAELWESLLIGNILSVSLLTWVVMPIVTRALRFWLEPEGGRADARLNARGTLACVAFLTFAAFVFWLCTTQIWHLP